MNPSDLDTAIAVLRDAIDGVRTAMLHVEVSRCDLAQVGAVRQMADVLRSCSDVLKTDTAVRAADLRLVDENGVVDEVLNPDGRASSRDELVEKARGGVLGNLPGLDDATRSGVLSAAYADVIATAVSKLSVDQRAEFYDRHPNLDEQAVSMSVRAFGLHVAHLVERVLAGFGVSREERQRHQRRASTFTEPGTGMFGLSAKWDPVTGQAINTAITAEVQAIYRSRRDDSEDNRSFEQILADAVTNLVCNQTVSTRSNNSGATAVVICDDKTRRDGPHDRSVHEFADGTPVAFDILHRILTDPATNIVEAVVNEHGVVQQLEDAVLNHGRHRRFATPDQKLALRVMHRSCLFPGCDVPFDRCEQHHLIEFQHHGRTDLIDLGPVCVRHHHQLHAHNWQLHLHPHTRALTIRYPDGTQQTHPFHGLAPPDTGPPGAEAPGDDPPNRHDADNETTGPRAPANKHTPPPTLPGINPATHGDAA